MSAGQTLFCSFCGRSQQHVAKLIAGPSVFICNSCVALALYAIHLDRDAVAEREVPSRDNSPSRCSFCGKAVTEVKRLATRKQWNICVECLSLCSDMILREENPLARAVSFEPGD